MKKFIFILTMLLVLAGFAQQTSPQDYLSKAREWSEVKLYDQALNTLAKGQEKYPRDHDLKAYEIRVLLWQQNFESANQKIESLLEEYPNDYEGLQLKTTSYWWGNKWEKLKESANAALDGYPNDSFFQEKKLIALLELKEYEAARKLSSQMQDKSKLGEKLATTSKLNFHQRAGVDYTYSRFNNTFSPWSVTKASYHRQSKHSWGASVSHGHMFSQDGVSVDGIFYPTFSKIFRGVIDAGGSNSEIFPRYRLGAELIADVQKLELRGGSRLMNFKSSEDQIFIHTAGVGIYSGDYYLNYKAYFAQINNNSSSVTHTFLARKNFSNRFHYLQINTSIGTTPLQVNNFSEISRLEATAVRLSYHTLLNGKFLMNASLGYQDEKYTSGNRTRIDGSIGLSVLF